MVYMLINLHQPEDSRHISSDKLKSLLDSLQCLVLRRISMHLSLDLEFEAENIHKILNFNIIVTYNYYINNIYKTDVKLAPLELTNSVLSSWRLSTSCEKHIRETLMPLP